MATSVLQVTQITFWIFLVILLSFGIAICVIIFINALKRTFFQNTDPYTDAQHQSTKHKIVDLFASSRSSLNELLTTVLPGMTALIDRGISTLETGVYMFQANNTWTKIAVPEIGDVFHILRGDHAKKQHTIRSSFIHEIEPPSEIQVFNNENPYQTLKETTQTVVIQRQHTTTPPVLSVNANLSHIHAQNTTATGRTLKIINASLHLSLTLTFEPFGEQSLIIAPSTIKDIHLHLTRCNDSYCYEVTAKSCSCMHVISPQ